MWRKFRRHRMALAGGGVLLFLYLTTAAAGFLSPYEKATRAADYLLAPPQRVRLFHDRRLLGPFVYSFERTRDPDTLQRIYTENRGDPRSCSIAGCRTPPPPLSVRRHATAQLRRARLRTGSGPRCRPGTPPPGCPLRRAGALRSYS